MIPKGFTATDVLIYGDTSNTIKCYSSSLQVNTAVQVGGPTNDGSNIDITDVIGDDEAEELCGIYWEIELTVSDCQD